MEDGDPQPRVSVVIPVYNDAGWIEETLDSVLAQTLPAEKMEVIVVDDGSTDDSRRRAEDKLDGADVSSTVFSIENSGPSRARNVGWRQSSGTWIQFLDADDLLREHKLARQVEKADDTDPSTAVVYSAWQELNHEREEWRPTVDRTPFVDEDPVRQLIESGNFVHLGCSLVRRSWLRKVGGFDEEYDLVEDVHLQLRLAMSGGGFRRIPVQSPVFLYRKRGSGSLSTGRPVEFCTACVRNASMVEKHWREKDGLTPERKETLLDIYFQTARTFAGEAPDRLQSVLKRIRRLDPEATPRGSFSFQLLSQLFGFPVAARVARAYHENNSLKTT